MNLQFIIAIVVAFLLAILIFKLVSKTFKLLVFLIIFAVIFAIFYFGYDAISNKFGLFGKKDVSPVTPSSDTSSYGCKADPDCAFVISPSDCNLAANSCNNLGDVSHFFKPGTKDKCAFDSIVLSPDIKCSCKKTDTVSYCERL